MRLSVGRIGVSVPAQHRGSMLALLRVPIVAIMMGFVMAGSIAVGFVDVSLALRLHLQVREKFPVVIINSNVQISYVPYF